MSTFLTSPLHGHHLACALPQEVRRQGTILLHETQSLHNPHQQPSSSTSACERAAGVRHRAIHDRALNVLAVSSLGFLSACQNVTPCNTQLWEECGRERRQLQPPSVCGSKEWCRGIRDSKTLTCLAWPLCLGWLEQELKQSSVLLSSAEKELKSPFQCSTVLRFWKKQPSHSICNQFYSTLTQTSVVFISWQLVPLSSIVTIIKSVWFRKDMVLLQFFFWSLLTSISPFLVQGQRNNVHSLSKAPGWNKISLSLKHGCSPPLLLLSLSSFINHKWHGQSEQGLIIHYYFNTVILGHQGKEKQMRDLGENTVHSHKHHGCPPTTETAGKT